ncbi:MAG: nitronate monooxygenase [Gammaproteobacteria bacterium]|nr:nitronate monooxygenase [Gammaproteobacteria bacterium]
MALPTSISSQLSLPAIAAPMFLVSGPELVAACCSNGVIGSFPTINARSTDVLESWLASLEDAKTQHPHWAPVAANLVVHKTNPRLQDDVDLLVKYQTPIVITSVGNPKDVVEAVHSYGGQVYADIVSIRHAEKAIASGVDGLILLCAGSGGQTGWANPFAFTRAVRAMFDGVIVLAGGVTDGVAIRAAQMLGADLVYMGTRFIAASESMAQDAYRKMLVDAKMDDILLTRAFTGLDANMLIPSIQAAGLDPNNLPIREHGSVEVTTDLNPDMQHKKRWKDIWSAGHGVGGIQTVSSAKMIIDQLKAEYTAAGQG